MEAAELEQKEDCESQMAVRTSSGARLDGIRVAAQRLWVKKPVWFNADVENEEDASGGPGSEGLKRDGLMSCFKR